MTKSASGWKKATYCQILPPPILKQLTQSTSNQHNLAYLLQNISSIEDQLKKIDEVVRYKLISAIIDSHIINDIELRE